MADTDSPQWSDNGMRAVAAYGLPQGWRDFLPCSVVFLRVRARAGMKERNAE
ncbi:MAG: hypothetical protein LBR52_00325 [Prevotellaceae bacterium]|nr:hypothetical protein [Prevotellaceae bacterium]